MPLLGVIDLHWASLHLSHTECLRSGDLERYEIFNISRQE